MADQELITELLSRLDERYDLQRYSSVAELIDIDCELREQLHGAPELTDELEHGLRALREMDQCLGCDSSVDAARWPDIPGYEVLGELGYGGMGVVYKARQVALNRTVAVKVMLAQRTRSRRVARRFRVEAEAVAQLKHPNIVQVHETGECEGSSYIVLEYMAGGNLARRLGGAPQPERKAAEVVRTIAVAVDHAHQAGIVHRDLKPSNILIGSDGTLKIADFGLAKLLDDGSELTRTGEAPGTPAYMSPEQGRGVVSTQSDIYALGAMLYELLTGRPPFAAETSAETMVLVQTSAPIAPRLVRPKLARDLEAICLKCLEREPRRRYSTAGDLADDLGRFLTGKPTNARPLSRAQRVVRWSGRNRGAAAMLATIALLLVGVTAVSTIAAIRIGRARDEALQTAAREHAAKDETARALAAEQESLAKAVTAERVAEREQAAAKTQATTADQVSDFLVNLFLTADPLNTGKLGFRNGEEIGKDITLRELLDRGASQAQRALKDQPVVRAKLLDTLGKVYSDLGIVNRAEPLIREAYELRQTHTDNEADLATSLLNMGLLLRAKGEYAEAERLIRQTLEMRTRLAGPDSLEVAEAEVALGWTLMESTRVLRRGAPGANEIAEFDKMMLHALEVQRRELKGSHRDVGLTLTILGLRYVMENKPSEAEKMFLQAAGIFASQKEGLSAMLGMMEFQAAATARKQRRLDEAERRYTSSIKMLEQALGRSNLFALVVKADFGGLLRDQGRMREYEQNGQEIAAHWDDVLRVFPNGHPMFIEPIEIWVECVGSQGKYDEAVMWLERKIAVQERFFQLPWAKTLDTLKIADIRLEQGRLDEVARLLNETQAAIEGSSLDTNEAAGAALKYRWLEGGLAEARGELAEAESIYRECLARPWNYYLRHDSMNVRLAMIVHIQRPFDAEAEHLLCKVIGDSSSEVNPAYPHGALPRLFLAQLLLRQGRTTEAEQPLRDVHAFVHQKTIAGSYYIGIADSLMGAWLSASGKQNEAEPLLVAGMENLRKSRGDHHRLTHEALDRLANFYRQNGCSAEAERHSELLTMGTPQPADSADGK